MLSGKIRQSAVAGTWYPGKQETLRTTIEAFFGHVSSAAPDGEILALVSPHAGYVYSGQVAAYAYKAVRKKRYDAVIVAGPSHRVSFRGVSIYTEGGFETPMGIMAVESELARRIIEEGAGIFSGVEEHALEHSIEIQLPFLQVVFEGVPFVPVLMGDQDQKTCEDLAEAIVRASEGKRILVVGSSDLSHYYPYDRAVKMDSIVLGDLENMNPEGLLTDLHQHKGEACGGGPIAVAMMAARGFGADGAKVLKYSNSGDVTGDKSGVVGYASAVFYRKVH